MKNFLLSAELFQLEKSLFYLKMDELRKICQILEIPHKEQKPKLIQKILFYFKTGKVTPIKKLPEKSKAKKDYSYPLKPSTYILHGSYKNDYATRCFFKSIIGNHFHFTAFGIDWLNERWRRGKPPTYLEFAKVWKKEYERRKTEKKPAKKEWAYINFIQNYKKIHPLAKKEKIMKAWHEERKKHVKIVEKFLKKLFIKDIMI